MSKSISQTELFKRLDAPLHNIRWSWGSERTVDGAVFLRVWQDRVTKQDDRLYFMVTHHQKFIGREDNLGYQERQRHVALVRAGARCYMVVCLAEDVDAVPRKIKSFNHSELFVGGRVLELNGDTWVEMADRIPVTAAMLAK